MATFSGNGVSIGGTYIAGQLQTDAQQIGSVRELESYLRNNLGSLSQGRDRVPLLQFTEVVGRNQSSTIVPLGGDAFLRVQVKSREYVSIIPEADSLLLKSDYSHNVRIPLRFLNELIARDL